MPKTASLTAECDAEATKPVAPGELLRVAAAVFRRHGLAGATLAQVAAALGVVPATVTARFATKALLGQAVCAEAIAILKATDSRGWPGYGAGMRRTLVAARSFEDGYVVLVRDAMLLSAHQSSWLALRKRTAQRLRALLWHPVDPPPEAKRPPLTDSVVEPMVSFCIGAIFQWVEAGDPTNDDLFLRWCGQMMQAWRHNACELLNLDSPGQDWPFDTETPAPRRRSGKS